MFRNAALVVALSLALGMTLLGSGQQGAGAEEKEVAITGKFECEGTNPNGDAYKGTTTIEKKDDVYKLTWTIGQESYEGVGIRNGNILSVCWQTNGLSGLVVYKIEKGADGAKLVGKWTPSDGTKVLDETLTSEK